MEYLLYRDTLPSHFIRVTSTDKGLVSFPIALSIPGFLASDPDSLASSVSNSTLLALLSQHWSSQVIIHSPGQWLKSSCISRSSLRERDQAVIVSSVSSSSSCDGLDDGSVIHLCDAVASSSSLLSLSSLTVFAKAFLQGDFHVHFFCFCTGVTDTGTCWFCFSAFSGRSCCWGWSSCSVSHSGWNSCEACFHLIVRFRDLLFPLRVQRLNKPGLHPNMLRWFGSSLGCQGDSTLFKYSLLVFWILHLLRDKVQTSWRCPLPYVLLYVKSHTPCHYKLFSCPGYR